MENKVFDYVVTCGANILESGKRIAPDAQSLRYHLSQIYSGREDVEIHIKEFSNIGKKQLLLENQLSGHEPNVSTTLPDQHIKYLPKQ